jgi:hypothetical protein
MAAGCIAAWRPTPVFHPPILLLFHDQIQVNMRMVGKANASDKKIWRHLEHKYADLLATVEPLPPSSPGGGGVGGLDSRLAAVTPDGMNLRTLSYLISVMNQVFPDYDFTDVVEGRDFVRVPAGHFYDAVVDACNRDLASANVPVAFLDDQLWPAAEAAIVLAQDSLPVREQLEIYRFEPATLEAEDDPFRQGSNLWAFNFFLYNRKLKRILLFYGKCLRYGQVQYSCPYDAHASVLRLGQSLEGDSGLRSVTPSIGSH